MRIPQIAADVEDVWSRSWITPWVWPVIVVYNTALGAVLLAGGPARINGPSFATIRLVGHVGAGTVFVVVGLAVGAAAFVSRRALRIAGYLAMVAHLALAAGFVTAVLGEPAPLPVLPGAPTPVRAALTGVPSYLFIAAIHFANAAIYGRRGPAPTPQATPTVSDDDDPTTGPDAGEAGVRA
ncbi:hypothetical protein GCM10023201_40840 [Actinomycetospora corticicola]|uniref:Uncharacterized protein n=1 Tax=Actinomycetospora corticicola TaxID=663602 RepID=A0A7Y9J633_9PSEU|nr:hypothetical protein [Actinomycetospora corticicola]NYD36832.1 hypothetical protein [Actinomycetospora corticicola]